MSFTLRPPRFLKNCIYLLWPNPTPSAVNHKKLHWSTGTQPNPRCHDGRSCMKLFKPNPTPLNIISAELQRCTVTQPSARNALGTQPNGERWYRNLITKSMEQSQPNRTDHMKTWPRDKVAAATHVCGRGVLYFIHLITKWWAEVYFLNSPTKLTMWELLRRVAVGGRATIYFITLMTN